MYAMLREVSELAGIARRGMWFLEPGLTSTHDQPKPHLSRESVINCSLGRKVVSALLQMNLSSSRRTSVVTQQLEWSQWPARTSCSRRAHGHPASIDRTEERGQNSPRPLTLAVELVTLITESSQGGNNFLI